MKKHTRTPRSNASKTAVKKLAPATGRRAKAATSSNAAKPAASVVRRELPAGYVAVLTEMKQLIAESRRRALATVNRELVCLYWNIGRAIVHQQETAQWGDSVVERLAGDLRLSFPDMKGLTKENLFRTRKFYLASREIQAFLKPPEAKPGKVATASPQISPTAGTRQIVATLSPQLSANNLPLEKLSTMSRVLFSEALTALLTAVSWSHHKEIIGAVSDPAERYFYVAMSARERWSVRELRRQIESGLFLRYMSVKRDPEKCLPDDAESGDLLPFEDHYVLEFLGLGDEHSERELRKAILANLRDFFLEFGRDLTFVGEEYPLTIGNDTFYIDLVFFHRRLQCLIAVDLKIGSFQPEYVGKSLFYVTGLDEQIRLPHENPSIGLILCRDADRAQVRIALTPAAKKVGVATYQTALPDLRLIRQRLEQFSLPKETIAP